MIGVWLCTQKQALEPWDITPQKDLSPGAPAEEARASSLGPVALLSSLVPIPSLAMWLSHPQLGSIGGDAEPPSVPDPSGPLCSPPVIAVVGHRVAARVRCRGCSWAPGSPGRSSGSSQLWGPTVPGPASGEAQHHSSLVAFSCLHCRFREE